MGSAWMHLTRFCATAKLRPVKTVDHQKGDE
jgi:hypothetical protein